MQGFTSVFAESDSQDARYTVSGGAGAEAAAYGPGPTAPGTQQSIASLLHPLSGFGLGFWFSVGGFAALFLIRRSLPG